MPDNSLDQDLGDLQTLLKQSWRLQSLCLGASSKSECREVVSLAAARALVGNKTSGRHLPMKILLQIYRWLLTDRIKTLHRQKRVMRVSQAGDATIGVLMAVVSSGDFLMFENREMVSQAIATLKDVLGTLDTDASLAGASVHVQWAIDLLSDHAADLRVAPSITSLIAIDGN